MDNLSRKAYVFLRCLAALVLVAGVSAMSAADVVYSVDRIVSPGRITGTIVTNGATGVLSSADIIDWNLTVDADGIPATSGQLLGPLSGNNSTITVLAGNPLTATSTAIFFDFSLPGFTIFQMATPDSSVVWQLQAGIFSDELIRESLSPTLVQAFVTRPPMQQLIASAVAPSFPLSLTVQQLRILADDDDRLRLRASFTLDSGSDGVDPRTEPVTLKFSTPAGAFYPQAETEFPIQRGEFELRRDDDGFMRWRLTDAGRQRTGIERFDIRFDVLGQNGSILFVDRRTSLPRQAYDHVTVELTIGNDDGAAQATLVEDPPDSGRWRDDRRIPKAP